MTKRVLHVLSNTRGLETYPSVYNGLYLWRCRGYRNDIATAGDVEGFEPWLDNVYRLRGGYLARAAQLARISKAYDVVLSYEPRDLEILRMAQLIGRAPRASQYVHYSLEIPTAVLERTDFNAALHKWLIRSARIDQIVIQDNARRELLVTVLPKLAGLSPFYVPNSFVREIEPEATRVDWFDRLRAETDRLVLYVGALEGWALSIDLFRELRQIKDTVFVFSGWCREGFVGQVRSELGSAPNIVFDVRQKSRAELNYIVSRCDIGLAYYRTEDENVAALGLSSGKIMKYLSYGRPVVVNRFPATSLLIEEHGIGASADPGYFKEALERVSSNYASFREAARRTYDEIGDFKGPYNSLIDSIVVAP